MMLKIAQIRKSFGSVEVLKGISFELEAGKVLGLIGENGAGKSTMMNILGGIIQPSSGRMLMNDSSYEPKSPIDAQLNGIGFIHQELNLFPNLSIAENLYIQHFPIRGILWLRLIDNRKIRESTANLLLKVGLDLDPATKIESLSPAQCQMVEIVKVMITQPKVIIFDEPTTSLSRHEIEKLFELIRTLKQSGIAIIYISHNLEDVSALSDNIAVLRDGELVEIYQKEAFNIQAMIKGMIGREMSSFYPHRADSPAEEVILNVEGLSSDQFLKEISFDIKRKEVVGFYGLVGSGRSEMARMLFGLDAIGDGMITWKGGSIKKPTPQLMIKKGVAFLTEDRQGEGLLLGMNIMRNIQIAGLNRYIKGWLGTIRKDKVEKTVHEHVSDTRVKFSSLTDQLVSTLSGGNQQKVVLSKWLMTNPELFILDEPTKGIDVGAKREIYKLINELVAEGSGILLISSELEELMGICDRIIVMRSGTVAGTFDKDQFDRNNILETALHQVAKI